MLFQIFLNPRTLVFRTFASEHPVQNYGVPAMNNWLPIILHTYIMLLKYR